MKRNWTNAEKLVGRKMPAQPSHRETLLAGFVREDGSYCGRSNPNESYLKPAWNQLRKDRLVRMGVAIHLGSKTNKNDGIWYLTERGEAEADKAKKSHDAKMEARRQWASEHNDIMKGNHV